jgi:hypothetical protein
VAFAEKFNQKSSLFRPRKKSQHRNFSISRPQKKIKINPLSGMPRANVRCSFVHRPREVTDAAGEAGQATAVRVT